MKSPFVVLIIALCALGFASCSSPYSPDTSQIYKSTEPASPDQLALAHEAWTILSSPARKAEWPQARQRYNHALYILVERYRNDCPNQQFKIRDTPESIFVLGADPRTEERHIDLYDDLIPCVNIDTTFYLKERVTIDGLGVPLAGIVKANQAKLKKNESIKDSGNIHTLTAILDFDHTIGGRPSLRVIPRLAEEQFPVGQVQHTLAADFSAPIALFWKRENISNAGILGAFRPQKAANYMGLYFSEPYNPDKIPVLFTHGLMSTPATFANLTNRLMVDPVIRCHYQFWFFGYPSGISWAISAQAQRQALYYIFEEHGSNSPDSNINNLVMVGHSMGGLITRLNNSTRPWSMLNHLVKGMDDAKELTYDKASQKIDTLIPPTLKAQRRYDKLKELFLFNPPNQTSRIVFMATPHRGSSFADTWIGRLGQRLISLPDFILTEVIKTGTFSGDMLLLNPEKLQQELTSIRQLSPTSPFIEGIQEIRPSPGIPIHTIIGSRSQIQELTDSSDGIVPYQSSHLDWATSEQIVPSGHSVQDNIATAIILRYILRKHLIENNIPLSPKDSDVAPALWQSNPPMELPRTVTH